MNVSNSWPLSNGPLHFLPTHLNGGFCAFFQWPDWLRSGPRELMSQGEPFGQILKLGSPTECPQHLPRHTLVLALLDRVGETFGWVKRKWTQEVGKD